MKLCIGCKKKADKAVKAEKALSGKHVFISYSAKDTALVTTH